MSSPNSDLAITKTHDGGPWTIGKQGTWRVQVTNNGPSDNPEPIKVVGLASRGEFAFVLRRPVTDGRAPGADRSLYLRTGPAGLQVGSERRDLASWSMWSNGAPPYA